MLSGKFNANKGYSMIRALEDKVRGVLLSHPESRDNDQLLVSIIWMNDVGGPDNCKAMSAWELLKLNSRKKLSNIVSIWRCRQKLQELYPELRGDKWDDRQKHSKKVKNEIKKWKPTLF